DGAERGRTVDQDPWGRRHAMVGNQRGHTVVVGEDPDVIPVLARRGCRARVDLPRVDAEVALDPARDAVAMRIVVVGAGEEGLEMVLYDRVERRLFRHRPTVTRTTPARSPDSRTSACVRSR